MYNNFAFSHHTIPDFNDYIMMPIYFHSVTKRHLLKLSQPTYDFPSKPKQGETSTYCKQYKTCFFMTICIDAKHQNLRSVWNNYKPKFKHFAIDLFLFQNTWFVTNF